jgi:hypothetical protein
MKKDNVYVRENSVFFRQSCAICGEMERPYSLMFVNEQEQFVCEYHIIDNEVNLILTQDDIHRLDTLVFLGNQKEWEKEEEEKRAKKEPAISVFRHSINDNGERHTIIGVDLESLEMTYFDRTLSGIKVRGKLFLDGCGEEHYKSGTYDFDNKDIYDPNEVDKLPLFNNVKPLLLEMLKSRDKILKEPELSSEGSLPF